MNVSSAGAHPGLVLDASPLDSEHRYRGIGRYVQGLLEGFAQLGTSPMCLRQERSLPGIGGRAIRNGRTIRVVRPSRPRLRFDYVWNHLWLRRELRSAGTSLFHATDPAAAVVATEFLTVATVYDVIPLVFSKYLDSMTYWQRHGYLAGLRSLRHVQHVIAISHSTKQDLVDHLGLDPGRVTVVHLGVSVAHDMTGPAERSLDPLRSDAPYVLYVGSLEQHKGVDVLLESLRAVDVRLIVAGRHSPAQQEALQTSARQLGVEARVDYRGYVGEAELRALYRDALAFVFPSLYEGFGLPVLEAMAESCPVVTTSAASLPEVAGEAALVVAPGDSQGLSSAIGLLLDDAPTRDALIKLGRERVALFSWSSCAAATDAVYTRVLGPDRRRS